MFIKTSELEGAALDWAVAKAVGEQEVRVCAPMNTGVPICLPFVERLEKEPWPGAGEGYMAYQPSTDWSQGGPLIDKYSMKFMGHEDGFVAICSAGASCFWSTSHLVAAMRTIVAAELGNEVDVPDSLVVPT